jgi:acetoacetyl-CoA synthetase
VTTDRPLWEPAPARVAQTQMTEFMRMVRERHDVPISNYAQLYDWSVNEPEQFWTAVWAYCGVIAETAGDTVLVHKERMPGANWFPRARLNYAENLLRRRDATTALVFRGEDRVQTSLTAARLYDEVSRLAQALR